MIFITCLYSYMGFYSYPSRTQAKSCTDMVFVLSGSPRIEDLPACMFCLRFAGISGEFPACLSVSEIRHQLASS